MNMQQGILKCYRWIGMAVIAIALAVSWESSAQTLTLDWVVTAGASSTNEGHAVAIDDSGNVYVAGEFVQTIDFDPGPGVTELTANNTDNFVAKLDASGDLVWAVSYGGPGNGNVVNDIVVDASGSVYLTGSFGLTPDFDPGAGTAELTSAGGSDIYVLKLDSSGTFVWVRSMGGSEADVGESIAVDASGNIYTTGKFRDTVDFDPGAGTANLTSGGGDDTFISKLDALGNHVWVAQIEGSSALTGKGIDVDASGNVYSCGQFFATADFDPGAGSFDMTSVSSADIYVQKLDSSGALVWAVQFGGNSGDTPFDIAVDDTGAVYTTGLHRAAGDFDPGSGTFNIDSGSATDIFVQKMDTDSNFVWAVSMYGDGNERGNRIAVDADHNVYVTGNFEDTVDFDPGVGTRDLTASGSTDGFAMKLDNTGALAWVQQIGASIDGNGGGIAVDDDDHVLVTGYYRGTVDFDPTANTASASSPSNNDYFIERLRLQNAPVANDDTGVTDEDSVLSVVNGTAISLIDNDVELDTDDTITIASFDSVSAEGAAVSVNANGTFAYDPTGATALQALGNTDSVVDTFTYTITDGMDSDTATVSMTVNGVDEDTTPPVFSDISVDPDIAHPESEVTITFTVDEALAADPTVTVNGDLAILTSSSKGGTAFTYLYYVPEDAPTGPATIEITGVDLVGNPGTYSSTALLTLATSLPLQMWPAVIALLAVGAARVCRRRS